jgi:non-canonical (house-cleaning) NTP pyrophosphatase
MGTDHRAFWHSFQSGIEVAVSGTAADGLLGVRDGFLRYFDEGLATPVPVVVVPQPTEVEHGGLYLSDETTLAHARAQARELEAKLADKYDFFVGSEGGLQAVESGETVQYFVRCWTVVRGTLGETSGGSGSIEIPPRLLAGLDNAQIPYAVPGTRRSGGMISSLTGALETRRSATALSTFHAVSSMFYGILESRPRGRKRRPF